MRNVDARSSATGPMVAAKSLVNFAASETLLHGGTVFAASPRELLTPSPLAAIFRY